LHFVRERWYKGSIALSIWILVVDVKRMKPVSVFHWLGQCSDVPSMFWGDKKSIQFVKSTCEKIFKGSFLKLMGEESQWGTWLTKVHLKKKQPLKRVI